MISLPKLDKTVDFRRKPEYLMAQVLELFSGNAVHNVQVEGKMYDNCIEQSEFTTMFAPLLDIAYNTELLVFSTARGSVYLYDYFKKCTLRFKYVRADDGEEYYKPTQISQITYFSIDGQEVFLPVPGAILVEEFKNQNNKYQPLQHLGSKVTNMLNYDVDDPFDPILRILAAKSSALQAG